MWPLEAPTMAVVDSRLGKHPNLFYQPCNDFWSWNWGLEMLGSSSINNFHLHVLAWSMHKFCSNSTIQCLIYTKSIPENKNMEEKSSVLWRIFELWWRENFGGKKVLDLEMMNHENSVMISYLYVMLIHFLIMLNLANEILIQKWGVVQNLVFSPHACNMHVNSNNGHAISLKILLWTCWNG
jgi:hypothetical protein